MDHPDQLHTESGKERKVKKFLLFLSAAAVVALLASCGKMPDQPAPPAAPPAPGERSAQFLTLVSVDEFEKHPSRGQGWATVPSLTTAKVGDKLIFVFGFVPGTERVELNSWHWSAEHPGGVRVPGLPLVIDGDEARAGGIRTFRWTAEHLGRYGFKLYLADTSGRSLPGTPIVREVLVERRAPLCETAVQWFNVTNDLTREVVSGEVNLNDSRNRGLSFNWGVQAGSTARVSITLNSREVFSSALLAHSHWIAFSALEVGRLEFRLRVEPVGCAPAYERVIALRLVRR